MMIGVDRTLVRFACVALIGWVASGQGPGRLQLRGPLVEWLEFRPDSLAQCRLDTVTGYSPPFWRPPYWWCSRRLISREDVMQIDADSVVVMVGAVWDVSREQGQEEFARAERALESRLGPPQQRCRSLVVTTGRAARRPRRERCELSAAWFWSDTLQATLALVVYTRRDLLREFGALGHQAPTPPWLPAETATMGLSDGDRSFGLFAAHQLYRYTFSHSLYLILLTILDAVVIWLTWLEYTQVKVATMSAGSHAQALA